LASGWALLLAERACVAKPETILAWYRRLIARKFDGSKIRSYPGRPRIDATVEALIVQMARENSGWGYDRIVGALANLGHQVSDQTVGNTLKRYGIAPASQGKQKTTWKEFIQMHLAVMAGTDFFTVEVLTWRGLLTYYVLFFLHLVTRRVTLAGCHPASRRSADDADGSQCGRGDLLHDRDAKFCKAFDDAVQSGGARARCRKLPARSPNLNAFAECWVRSVKEECLAKLILLGEMSLQPL
jgi:hypothetical protein